MRRVPARRGPHGPAPKSVEETFWAKVDRAHGECWPWLSSKSRGGYGTLTIDHKTHYAHRVAFVLAGGVLVPGLSLDHLCSNRLCVRPSHLEQVPHAENIRRGRLAKIDAETVCRIKKWLSAGNTQASAARKFGVTKGTVNDIARGRSWRGVGDK